MLWKTLNDETNNLDSVGAFKKKIKAGDGAGCFCTICK